MLTWSLFYIFEKMRMYRRKLFLVNVLATTFLVMFFTMCKKETVVDQTEYYVKYVIDGRSSIQQSKTDGLKVTLTNENGATVEYIRSNRGSLEFNVGPVKKGFSAKLIGTNVCCVSCCYIKPMLQIFVSENNGPFVLKNEINTTEYKDVVQLDHTIQ
jgi:hypothetical protein